MADSNLRAARRYRTKPSRPVEWPEKDYPRRLLREHEPEGRTDFSDRRCPPDLVTLFERGGGR